MNRKESGSFSSIPHILLNSENYASLKPRAVKLLLDIYGQFKGKNNGDLTIAFSIMKKVGWTSKDQLYKAKEELLKKGWIVVTRQGGRKIPTLYAVTFRAINECGGKLDRGTTKVPLSYWKQGVNPEY